MYTQCHRSTDKQNATKVVHRNRLLEQVCAWGGGGKPPPPPQPPTPAETKPSQAKPVLKGRPVYLPSPPAESPEFPTLSVAKPTRSDPSRAGPLSLNTIFFKATMYMKVHHRYSAHENPVLKLLRYLYLTQRVPSRVCSRRRSHVHTVPSLHRQTKCHKSCTSQPAIGTGVCLGGEGASRPLPPNPHPR